MLNLKIIGSLVFTLFLIFIISCSSSRFVKPLDKNQIAISFNAGGPIITNDDKKTPLPFSSFTGGYGINNSLTAFLSFNTSSPYVGTYLMEFGMLKGILKQQNYLPGISLSAVGNLAIDDCNCTKLWPQFDINAFWNYAKKRHYFYSGISNWINLPETNSEGVKENTIWVINPHLGHTFVTNKWRYNLEFKYASPKNIKLINVSNKDFEEKGAIGIYFSITRLF